MDKICFVVSMYGNKICGGDADHSGQEVRFLSLRKLEGGKNADGMAKAMIDTLLPYKADIQTITSDNGAEFARHTEISQKLGADFYFAHPYSSWERGINENTNSLIRQYIPKTEF